MTFGIFSDYGALNSAPVFEAFKQGVEELGHEIKLDSLYHADVAVIWSVLFQGRMQPNKKVWDNFRLHKKPVIVLEVGSLFRQHTWRMGINGINKEAYFGPSGNSDYRANKLMIKSKPWRINKDGHILICTQSYISEQWKNYPPIEEWLDSVITHIRNQTDRKIVIRPHPRFPVRLKGDYSDVYFQPPQHVKNDVWDLELDNVYAVVNATSSPGVQSVLEGVPAFVGEESMASPVANAIYGSYESPSMPDRTQWINDLAYSEWTLDEIKTGMPLSRIMPKLEALTG